jgi:hypothetical protein
VGAPYDAAAKADLPVGKYLQLSEVGIPSGAMNVPMQSNSQFGGGRRRRYNKRSKKGGCCGKKGRHSRHTRRGRKYGKAMRGGGLSAYMSTLLPDDAMNAFRSVPAAFGHLSDKFSGLVSSPSSMVYPTQQPLVQTPSTSPITPPDIKGIYNSASTKVSGI